MSSHIESDFELAQRLQHELNESFGDIISISDTEEDVKVEVPAARELKKVKEEVCFDNQQAITIQREKSSDTDFFMKAMRTYLDLSTSQEWSEVDMSPNLQHIFDKLKSSFFSPWLDDTKYTVTWDKTCVISDGSSFRFFESHREVLVASLLLVKPRIQLISVILHILIHIYLSTSSKGTIKIGCHAESFRELFLFFNKSLTTEISTSHKLQYSPDEEDYPSQWYQCTGICSNYEPFKGIVRCTSIPGSAQSFWKQHDDNCGGQFFKIFEIERFNPTTQGYDKKYVRNVRYMYPKPLELKVRSKATTAPRELLDLTDDDEPVKVENLCDFVNLDDSEFNMDCDPPEAPKTPDFVQRFIRRAVSIFSKCSLCEQKVCVHQFQSHLDCCRGFQKKVVFSVAKSRH